MRGTESANARTRALCRAAWAVAAVAALGAGCNGNASSRALGPDPNCPAAAAFDADAAAVQVDLDAPAAVVDEKFLSFSIDSSQFAGGNWWSEDGSDDGVVGGDEVEPFDFSRTRLRRLARELAPAFLRIGGTEADRVYYDVDGSGEPLPTGDTLRLTAELWDGLTDFARSMGFDLMFTLNAGRGPRDAVGNWTAANARELIAYAAGRGDPVTVWELGNELNGYLVTFLDTFPYFFLFPMTGARYAADLALLRDLLDELDPDARLAGPSSAFWPAIGEPLPILPSFLSVGGAIPDIIPWHYYPQQSERCPLPTRPASLAATMDPATLDEVGAYAAPLQAQMAADAPQAEIWMGETGNSYCGGQVGVSDRFAGGFWWLDELGQLARRGHKVVVRQTLSGSNYGLLKDSTLEAQPDYWNSLLWKRLMGTRALDVALPGAPRTVRAYAHCTAPRAPGYAPGAVTAVVLNLDPARGAEVGFPAALGTAREVYRLTALGLDAALLCANDRSLVPAANGAPPPIAPARERSSDPLVLAPESYAFVVFPEAGAPACP